MFNATAIHEISEQIRKEFSPQKIILFGSHSWGKPSAESDIDLLVITEFEGKPWRLAVEIKERIKPTIPLDLIVRTPQQIRERLAKQDTFLTEIVEKGTVLYEA